MSSVLTKRADARRPARIEFIVNSKDRKAVVLHLAESTLTRPEGFSAVATYQKGTVNQKATPVRFETRQTVPVAVAPASLFILRSRRDSTPFRHGAPCGGS